MKKIRPKRIIIAVIVITLGIVYADVNYNIIGSGERAYCYVLPFLAPKDTAASDIPVGKFIGSKAEIEKVKEANLDFQTDWILYSKYNDPGIILPFMIDLPESKTVDPDSLPNFEKSKLLKLGLWDGKGKISFVATFKRGAVIREKEYEAVDALLPLIKKYPELFKISAEKVKSLKQGELNSKEWQLINSAKNENEKKIIENLLLIRNITGIAVQSESQLESLKAPRKMLAQIIGNKDFKTLRNKISKDIESSIIGIRVNGNRAILVYGIPDGLTTELRKFAKVGDTYKLYTITGVKHTKSIDSALANYWNKVLKTKCH